MDVLYLVTVTTTDGADTTHTYPLLNDNLDKATDEILAINDLVFKALRGSSVMLLSKPEVIQR